VDKASIASKTTRTQRGIALYREHGDRIIRRMAHVYSVPSCSGDSTYTVDTSLGFCTCPDHDRAKALGTICKHRVAAEIVQSKHRALRRKTKSA
jgi:uncharacterized Zn finger protein